MDHKHAAREADLQLRLEEIKLNEERFEERKLEMQHSGEQTQIQMDLLLSFRIRK